MCIDDNAGNLYVVVQEISFNSAVWIARMLYFSVDWLHDICKAVEFKFSAITLLVVLAGFASIVFVSLFFSINIG